MFYVMAILICLSILATSIAIFFRLPGKNADYSLGSRSKGSVLDICFGIHSVSYIGLVLLMICTMIQITIGLKRSYDCETKIQAAKIAKRNVRVMYAGCLFVFLITATVEIFALMPQVLTQKTIQIWYCILSSSLFLTYGISLYYLFRYMNTEENPALRPEHSKMAWQAVYYMLSLAIFFTIKLFLLMQAYPTNYVYFLLNESTLCLTDIAPLAYVIYCHNRIFDRMAANNITYQNLNETTQRSVYKSHEASMLAGKPTLESSYGNMPAPTQSESNSVVL